MKTDWRKDLGLAMNLIFILLIYGIERKGGERRGRGVAEREEQKEGTK